MPVSALYFRVRISHLGARKKWSEKVPIFEGVDISHLGARKSELLVGCISGGTLKKCVGSWLHFRGYPEKVGQ